MEQARHWMFGEKHRLSETSSHQNIQPTPNVIDPSYEDSTWEEQAFAEDAGGYCIWPPRSYSCSFCRREFKSAQALGGHMNIHRRDRARLKQSPPIFDDHDLVQRNQSKYCDDNLRNPYTSVGSNFHPRISTLVYNPDPNSDDRNHHGLTTTTTTTTTTIASPCSPSRVSSAQESCLEKTFFPTFSSTIVEQVQHKRKSLIRSPSPPKRKSDPRNSVEEEESIPTIQESKRTKTKLDYVKSDLSVSLNLVVRRTRPTVLDIEEEVARVNFKRRKTEASSSPFILRSNSVDGEITPTCSIDELDLELRLGDGPNKVK